MLRLPARAALLLTVLLGASACDSGAPDVPRAASVQVTGAYASSFDADASFVTRTSEAQAMALRVLFAFLPVPTDEFTLSLSDGPNAPAYLYVSRGAQGQPAVGRYPITTSLWAALYPSSRFHAGILYQDPAESRSVASRSGSLVITRSEPGLLEGTFEFQAVGRGPSGSGLGTDADVSVRGSFRAQER